MNAMLQEESLLIRDLLHIVWQAIMIAALSKIAET